MENKDALTLWKKEVNVLAWVFYDPGWCLAVVTAILAVRSIVTGECFESPVMVLQQLGKIVLFVLILMGMGFLTEMVGHLVRAVNQIAAKMGMPTEQRE